MVINALPGILKVTDIVQGIKVSNCGHAVFFEHFGMQVNDITGTLAESNNVNTTGQSLKRHVRSNFSSESIHHVECGLSAVKEETLKSCSTTRLNICDTGIYRSLNSGEKIIC